MSFEGDGSDGGVDCEGSTTGIFRGRGWDWLRERANALCDRCCTGGKPVLVGFDKGFDGPETVFRSKIEPTREGCDIEEALEQYDETSHQSKE